MPNTLQHFSKLIKETVQVQQNLGPNLITLGKVQFLYIVQELPPIHDKVGDQGKS